MWPHMQSTNQQVKPSTTVYEYNIDQNKPNIITEHNRYKSKHNKKIINSVSSMDLVRGQKRVWSFSVQGVRSASIHLVISLGMIARLWVCPVCKNIDYQL